MTWQRGDNLRGERHHNWHPDGRLPSSHGYIKVRVGVGHPHADPNGYAYEHLLVWLAAGNEPPPRGFVIHHRNENKSDNRLENLEVKTKERHGVDHNPGALSDSKVREMRERFRATGCMLAELAAEFGVPHQRAWKIVTGKSRMGAGGPVYRGRLKGRKTRLLDGREWNEVPGEA